MSVTCCDLWHGASRTAWRRHARHPGDEPRLAIVNLRPELKRAAGRRVFQGMRERLQLELGMRPRNALTTPTVSLRVTVATV